MNYLGDALNGLDLASDDPELERITKAFKKSTRDAPEGRS